MIQGTFYNRKMLKWRRTSSPLDQGRLPLAMVREGGVWRQALLITPRPGSLQWHHGPAVSLDKFTDRPTRSGRDFRLNAPTEGNHATTPIANRRFINATIFMFLFYRNNLMMTRTGPKPDQLSLCPRTRFDIHTHRYTLNSHTDTSTQSFLFIHTHI